MPSFKVKVVTYTREFINQDADYLRVRTSEGDLGIMANHSPLVAELDMGEMAIQSNSQRDLYFVSGGFLEISNNEVTVIADEIISLNDIDLGFEEKEVQRLKEFLSKAEDEEEKDSLNRKIKERLKRIEIKKN